MKNLVNDIISIFSPHAIQPVVIRTGLSPRELAALQPMGITSVSWVTSMEELNDAFVKKALDAGAVGYHIIDVESHKPGNDGQYLLAARATLYHINDRVAHG